MWNKTIARSEVPSRWRPKWELPRLPVIQPSLASARDHFAQSLDLFDLR
jgi:hypothetical protein